MAATENAATVRLFALHGHVYLPGIPLQKICRHICLREKRTGGLQGQTRCKPTGVGLFAALTRFLCRVALPFLHGLFLSAGGWSITVSDFFRNRKETRQDRRKYPGQKSPVFLPHFDAKELPV
jgi:hypothetical protein